MFGMRTEAANNAALIKALNASLAIIEFDPKGTILSANANFCGALGYSKEEIIGKHHSMFVDPDYVRSQEYRDFWSKLARGEFDAREYKRIGKGGIEIWIQATYNPVVGPNGQVCRVVKLASDITSAKLKSAEYEAKLEAISLVQAIIEFNSAGEILTANPMFCTTMGYSLDEIKGRHHRMFVEPSYAASSDYQAFWTKLNRGEYQAGLFTRVAKGGRLVQLQASYNPIFDLKGRVAKVVKYANDLSDLMDLGAALGRLAQNDVEHPIVKEYQPVLAPIRRDFNVAQEKLKTSLLSIAECAQTVATGAKEIAVASDNLSRRTEQQAASLEQTAAALNTVTDTVKNTADGSKQATAAVNEARANAEKGGEVVRRAVDAMGLIEKSSQQISQIISVIDEIAFQTNLLALNAGVEAARAGEAGRGFAVVASEVRALAQRSAEAAKEIKGLISASSEQVGDGVKLVGETGAALGQIIGRIEEVTQLIAKIASGAQEQATSLHEVNIAVNEMDQATQQNAAMAEEASAGGASMTQEAERLANLVSQFKLGRPDGDSAMRAELKRVAPHAFGGSAPARSASPGVKPAVKSAQRLAPPRAKLAAGGGGAAASNGDWGEF